MISFMVHLLGFFGYIDLTVLFSLLSFCVVASPHRSFGMSVPSLFKFSPNSGLTAPQYAIHSCQRDNFERESLDLERTSSKFHSGMKMVTPFPSDSNSTIFLGRFWWPGMAKQPGS